jgi:HTH-type transcriptional regulator, competence development regulator
MDINGMRLRELRVDRTLSVRELAQAAGVHYTTVIRIEGGHGGAHPRTIRKLARALEVEPRELR